MPLNSLLFRSQHKKLPEGVDGTDWRMTGPADDGEFISWHLIGQVTRARLVIKFVSKCLIG